MWECFSNVSAKAIFISFKWKHKQYSLFYSLVIGVPPWDFALLPWKTNWKLWKMCLISVSFHSLPPPPPQLFFLVLILVLVFIVKIGKWLHSCFLIFQVVNILQMRSSMRNHLFAWGKGKIIRDWVLPYCRTILMPFLPDCICVPVFRGNGWWIWTGNLSMLMYMHMYMYACLSVHLFLFPFVNASMIISIKMFHVAWFQKPIFLWGGQRLDQKVFI